MSFCFLYNVVSENHSVQNSPWGGGEGGLLPAQGLGVSTLEIIFKCNCPTKFICYRLAEAG